VSTAGDSHDSNPQGLFNHVVEALNPIGLAYMHVVEGETGGARDSIAFDYNALRDRFAGTWMVNNGYNREMAMKAVASGRVDLVSFGRLFLANPDLVERLSINAPLNPLMDQHTFYGGGDHGYIDYPKLKKSKKSTAGLEVVST
jgi:N-ethylmaleimide reductase